MHNLCGKLAPGYVHACQEDVSWGERGVTQTSRRRGEERVRSGIGRHVQAWRGWNIGSSCYGEGARITHPFTTTMLRSAPRITRPAIRLLADLKPSQKLAQPNARSLHQQHPLVHPFLVSRNLISAASTSIPTSQLSNQGGVEALQTRSFTSTSSNSTRHPRSDDLRRRTVVNRPLVGMTDDDLPRKDRKANPFLPFQASSFVDAFVTTIVGVGISELCKYERI